jgi:hypothetical protein
LQVELKERRRGRERGRTRRVACSGFQHLEERLEHVLPVEAQKVRRGGEENEKRGRTEISAIRKERALLTYSAEA